LPDRPVIFSAPMIKALLDGRKTMTRHRLWRERPDPGDSRLKIWVTTPWRHITVGDRLWARESFAAPSDQATIYRANWREDALARGLDNVPTTDAGIRWRPSIHMPRWASRITLEVTAAKIERLQEISEEDAEAEGATPANAGQDIDGPIKTFRTGFVRLWGDIHGTESCMLIRLRHTGARC
jgi:hypothetical protein